MHSFILFSSCFFASTVVSKPISTRATGFTIQQVAVEKPRPKLIDHQFKLAKKYNIPFSKLSVGNGTQKGSAPATPQEYDISYLVPVTIDGKTFNLNLDTGSSDLWVFSSGLPDAQEVGHSVYDTTKEQKLANQSWSISYADGSGASGDVYRETVVIGGVTVTSQAVEAATSISSGFVRDVDNDGLIGAAFPKLNTVKPTKQKTLMDNLNSTGQIAEPIFASLLLHNQTGAYDFGFIDNTKFVGDITYHAVNSSEGHWSVKTALGDAIVDTGTSLVYLPDADIEKYWSQVAGAKLSAQQGGWVFNCTTSLPDYSLLIDEEVTWIAGKYINYAPIGDGTCFGGIQGSTALGVNLLGDVWIKNKYIVFDQTPGSPKIGVGLLNYLS